MAGTSPRPQTPAEMRHSINNLLNGISSQAELAKLYLCQGDLDEAVRALDRIVADCKRYSALQRDLIPD